MQKRISGTLAKELEVASDMVDQRLVEHIRVAKRYHRKVGLNRTRSCALLTWTEADPETRQVNYSAEQESMQSVSQISWLV